MGNELLGNTYLGYVVEDVEFRFIENLDWSYIICVVNKKLLSKTCNSNYGIFLHNEYHLAL